MCEMLQNVVVIRGIITDPYVIYESLNELAWLDLKLVCNK